MDKKSLITIFVFFLLSNQLYNIVWEIGKAIFYVVLIIFGLNYLNPELSDSLKKYIINLINLDKTFIKTILGSINNQARNIFNNIKPKKNKENE
tara:strand:+ start:287 stop:568 length:282 start_codon:yes stop_codon:yes gene_type:complete